jgi:CcmD family protein
MTYSVIGLAVVLLGVVFYLWFLSLKQRELTKSVEMLERLQQQTNACRATEAKAA